MQDGRGWRALQLEEVDSLPWAGTELEWRRSARSERGRSSKSPVYERRFPRELICAEIAVVGSALGDILYRTSLDPKREQGTDAP
jgi:hypothetical protein